MYHNIPAELQRLPQWVCAGSNKIPLNPRNGRHANVTDPTTWGTFEEACKGDTLYIGLVLTDGDPYCVIDLDNKPEAPLSDAEWQVHKRILDSFPTYIERSASGRGYHIVCRARLKQGRRRGTVEVYSSQRYMIFTGNALNGDTVHDCQTLVDALIAEMPLTVAPDELQDNSSRYSDAQVHDMARNATNGAKYDGLCAGTWQEMGYPSQSEADFALLSIIGFYTRDNEQVRRIFRCTALGKRAKAIKDDRYIDTALRKIRSGTPSDADLVVIAEQAQLLMRELWKVPAPPPAPTKAQAKAGVVMPPTAGMAMLPPGLVGEIAAYIYASSVRPVREVSLCAALGLVAGIAARAFNISGAGLNQYILLVAKTGTGKEDGPKGIERLMTALRLKIPAADDFIGPSTFASGQALIRVLDGKPCFVSLLGEFGLTLQMLNDPRAPSNIVMLKKVLLDLYAKSGWNNVLRSTAYSDAEKNTKTVHAPNMSFVGDATPETFFDSLGTADIADGLVPRLHVVEYTGQRPSRNKNNSAPPDAALIKRVEDLAAQALTMRANNAVAHVQVAPDALFLLDRFDEECDGHMRREHHVTSIQLWNRAHLKALKLAALIAVGVDAHAPTVTVEMAEWGIAFTRDSTVSVLARFDAGDVGRGEAKQMVELRRAVDQYFLLGAESLRAYKVKADVQKQGLIPFSYLSQRAGRLSCFQNDRRGAARALSECIELAVASEVLAQVPKTQALTALGKRENVYFRGGNW